MLARIAVVWAALMYVAFGLWLLLAPEKLGDWLGVEAASAQGRTEIRAFYGGVQLGTVVFLLVGLFHGPWLAPACAVLACVNLGVVACRVGGIVVDGSGSTAMWGILATEAVTGLLAVAGLVAATMSRSAP